MNTRRFLSITIALLGLATAYGTQRYLSAFLTFWPAVLAAAAIEMAYITLAISPLTFEDDPDGIVIGTARWLVFGSVLMNFGHAYQVAAPGALSGEGRLEILAAVQAGIVAIFAPVIVYRLAQVLNRVSSVQEGTAQGADQGQTERELDLARAELERVQAELVQAQKRSDERALTAGEKTRALVAAQEENQKLIADMRKLSTEKDELQERVMTLTARRQRFENAE